MERAASDDVEDKTSAKSSAGTKRPRPSSDSAAPSGASWVQLGMRLPRSSLGPIIGAKGSNIQGICSRTGAQVHVDSAHSIASISGDVENARLAMHELWRHLSQEGVRFVTLRFSLATAGALSAAELERLSSAQVSIQSDEDLDAGALERDVTLTGSEPAIAKAFDAILSSLAPDVKFSDVAVPEMDTKQLLRTSDRDRIVDRGSLTGLRVPESGSDEALHSIRLAIPSDVAPIIIGKGGVNIRSMRDECGCAIVFESRAIATKRASLFQAVSTGKPSPELAPNLSDQVSYCTIIGTPAAVGIAQEKLRRALGAAMTKY